MDLMLFGQFLKQNNSNFNKFGSHFKDLKHFFNILFKLQTFKHNFKDLVEILNDFYHILKIRSIFFQHLTDVLKICSKF